MTSERTGTALAFRDLGLLDYDVAWDLQKALVAERVNGDIDDTVLFVEHPPTITLGRAADAGNVLLTAYQLTFHVHAEPGSAAFTCAAP